MIVDDEDVVYSFRVEVLERSEQTFLGLIQRRVIRKNDVLRPSIGQEALLDGHRMPGAVDDDRFLCIDLAVAH